MYEYDKIDCRVVGDRLTIIEHYSIIRPSPVTINNEMLLIVNSQDK